jgi:hypothetical protein
MQRNFEPMRKQVEAWQGSELTDVSAKVVIYEAFVSTSTPAEPSRRGILEGEGRLLTLMGLHSRL